MSVNCFSVLYNTSFKEHLPEDGHNRWPKHVAGNPDHNIINHRMHLLVITHKKSSAHGHESFKTLGYVLYSPVLYRTLCEVVSGLYGWKMCVTLFLVYGGEPRIKCNIPAS
jgi:thiosulfate reductase cytochrome b subunit